jgi:NTP pyrophosphatase (non-canonical NTP hydrolase)
VKEVYGLSNDRYFSLWDMITNMERFVMRGLKGIRKNDQEKIKLNLLIANSWFMSITNQLHIDIEDVVWKRFPYLCSYCASCPCSCKEKKLKRRERIFIDNKKRPKNLTEFQNMFNKIYPAGGRTIEHSGVHLIEEMGEFSEAILTFRGRHEDKDFKNIELEAADLYSCLIGVFNSLNINMAKEISTMFAKNCHVCKNAPCTCNFKNITSFKS